MSTVRIPPVLRRQAGGTKRVEVPGATVGEVLDGLVRVHPALRALLFTDDGTLSRFINVYVAGQDIRATGELATPVGERDEVMVLPPMTGGAGQR